METKRNNRLQRETSPYLLQHATNPVDWYPWGPEALERARREDKPIFLSVGYSACHWCHVMERESFEDAEIADLMNRRFVNIKVDREERPDIDEIYMKAVTAMTGSGGWPMSVFLTPDLKPFFGTTYLPPVRRYGRASFPEVLTALSEAWQNEREQVVEQSARLSGYLREESQADLRGELSASVLDDSLQQLLSQLDATWGGFGAAPKFPHSGDIRILLRHHRRSGSEPALHAATHSLIRMARGGIYDQLGGGFHRYSTDEQWRIPHFEKMLYDNALLIPAYLEAHLVTGDALFREVARGCADWVLREMVTAEGGFASAQDADSEGEEGRFFVWTPAQLSEVLGAERARMAAAYYDVSEQGNFEHGKSALWLPREPTEVAAQLEIELSQLEEAMTQVRQALLEARSRRVRPATDDKVLSSWNGLMISAMCQAYQVLELPDCLAAARAAARYVLGGMRQPDGRLFATARAGHAHINACLDDYVFMVQALIDLYESDFDSSWLREALALSDIVQARFVDPDRGGYFTVGDGHERLIARMKNLHDGALPAATGVQALNLLRLSQLTGRGELGEAAERALGSQAKLINRHPRLFGQALMALDFVDAGPRQVVISGRSEDPRAVELLRAVRATFEPARVVALARPDADAGLLAVLEGRVSSDDAPPGAYLCRDFACRAPTGDPAELRASLVTRSEQPGNP